MAAAETRTAYIGLGSNLDSPAGSPKETIAAALRTLGEAGKIIAQSSFYETAPVGNIDQPAFINAVAVLQTDKSPENLLHTLLQIERTFGRNRGAAPPKGPRTLDLDLLMLDDLIVSTPILSLPHPALQERRFVLAPLAEIAPDLVHPQSGKTMRELLRRLPDAGENRIDAVRIYETSQ